jgi:hypothetical protein
MINENVITRVTPTSSDQRIDVEYELDLDREQSEDGLVDNEEEVVVDNIEDENDTYLKRKSQSSHSHLRSSNNNKDVKKR